MSHIAAQHGYPAISVVATSPLNNHVMGEGGGQQRNCFQLVLTLVSLFLLVAAMAFSVLAGLSPSWQDGLVQVVDIREFLAEHHHGLWLDCTRAELPLSRRGSLGNAVEKSPLHCTSKLDSDARRVLGEGIEAKEPNAAAAEAEHHQFYGWHKAVLLFIIASLLAGGGAFVLGLCSPCSPSCALIHSVLCFFALLFSVTALSVFFFAAHRVDARFVQGLVGTYEQSIGEAFYLYLGACVLFMVAFILGTVGTYSSLRTNELLQRQREEMADTHARVNGLTRTSDVLMPLYPHSRGNSAMMMGVGGGGGMSNGMGRFSHERKTQV